ncbi:DUF4192 family protein [Nocardia sp. 2YAB30]|uniref:DUF4192 family protein n=1 Tax=unclassified Nocardia TaxID=2637762 RepID=UPI003F99CF08
MSAIHDPGRFVAEALALLPQPPRRSLVVMLLREMHCWPDAYVAVERIRWEDLFLAGDYLATVPILSRTLRACAMRRPDAVAIVIVDDATPDRPVPNSAHRELATLVRDRLAELGTDVIGAWALTGRESGRPWWSLFDDEHGVLPYQPP